MKHSSKSSYTGVMRHPKTIASWHLIIFILTRVPANIDSRLKIERKRKKNEGRVNEN